jgi:hypothetical protein
MIAKKIEKTKQKENKTRKILNRKPYVALERKTTSTFINKHNQTKKKGKRTTKTYSNRFFHAFSFLSSQTSVK